MSMTNNAPDGVVTLPSSSGLRFAMGRPRVVSVGKLCVWRLCRGFDVFRHRRQLHNFPTETLFRLKLYSGGRSEPAWLTHLQSLVYCATTMRLLELNLPHPAENLALDESLLLAAEEGDGGEVLRLWENHDV